MNEYHKWSLEAEKKEQKARKVAGVIIGFVVCLSVVALLVQGAMWKDTYNTLLATLENGTESEVPQVQARITEAGTPVQNADAPVADMENYLAERLAHMEQISVQVKDLGVGYDGAWPVCKKSSSCIVKKDGLWGMVSGTGEILVPLKFERYSFRDNTGWVEFEQNGHFFVYDDTGTLIRIYTDKTVYRMESEEAYLFRTAKAYMSGMVMKTIIPEISENDYYGVEYYNRRTGELLYRAVGSRDEVGIYTYPDETGRAVALQSNGYANVLYYITETGCESRVLKLPEGVNGRWFDFPGDYGWADIALSNGWLKVDVCDAVPGFLMDEYIYYTAFLNVDTLELVPFPEEYQGYFMIYDMGYKDAMAVRLYDEGDNYKYAICKGDRKLTEEIYYWVVFDEKYMFGCQDAGMDILNYNGDVLATYWDVSGSFVNGKMLVSDGEHTYFIDESLKHCSEDIVTGPIDRCFSRGVIIDDLYYILDEFMTEPKELQKEIPTVTCAPAKPSEPEWIEKDDYQLVETELDIHRYYGDMYIIRNGDYYGIADLDGNILVAPKYPKWIYTDQNWVSFEDVQGTTHVFNHNGKEVYFYKYNEGVMTTEQGQQFNRTVFYRQGMKIVFDYNDQDNYYGIHYYNAETGELIFELTEEMKNLSVEPWPDLLVTSMPDATGTAVVIAGDGFENTMYKITKDGYTSEFYREYYVERRFFDYSVHNVVNRTNLTDGWLLVTMTEERGELLDYSKEVTDVLYNIHTKERVPLPAEYQIWYGEYYQQSKGIYYGMSGESLYDYDNGETECIYYAVCHGSRKLTEEIYQWINFGEDYIIAGNSSFSHILDYEGNVLAEYKDVAFPFVDGKTLVSDETGAFFIDENLQKCSDYIVKGVEYCHPNFILQGNRGYLVKWPETKE